MKKSELKQIIREEIGKLINEATTEFEFDPTKYAKGIIKVKEDEDFLNGRPVGKNYKFSNTSYPNLTLKVSRWKEGKEPNNYTAYLSIPGTKDTAMSMVNQLNANLKLAGSIRNNDGTSSFQFNRYDMSAKELMNLLKSFRTIAPNN